MIRKVACASIISDLQCAKTMMLSALAFLHNENAAPPSVHITASLVIITHEIFMLKFLFTKIASLSSQLPSLSTLLLHGNKMQQISPEILSSIARYFIVDKIGLY